MGFVKNKVLKFQGDIPSIDGVYKTQEGKPIRQLYVLKVDRIVRDEADMAYVQSLVDNNPNYFATYQRPELGDFLYADTNGDGSLDSNDRIEMGDGPLPTFTYGGNIGLSWKNFDFSMLFQGVGDYKVYYNNQAFRFVTVMGQSLNKDITDNAWTPETPITQSTRFSATTPTERTTSQATRLSTTLPISDARTYSSATPSRRKSPRNSPCRT